MTDNASPNRRPADEATSSPGQQGEPYGEGKGAFQAPLDINGIRERIPHRYPFLLIDRIVEVRDNFVAAIKCVSANEPFFQGHFPERPLMPGVLQVEAIAQAGAVMEGAHPDRVGKLLVLAGVDEARFRRPVVPGDVLRIEVEEVFRRRSIGRSKGRILIDGELACEAVITFGVQSLKG